MSFLLSNCNELSFDGLVAVNGGYYNLKASGGYSAQCSAPPPKPPLPPEYGTSPSTCSGSGVFINYITGTPTSPNQPSGYTTTQDNLKPLYIIDVNKLKKMYY